MGRRPCCSKEGMNRGAWTAMEDKILTDFIKLHGDHGKWRSLPKRAGLKRCGKSCRLRWLNYLRPDIKRGNITIEEEDLIIRLHKLLGNRWSLIAGRLPGRTDNEVKNYWNTVITKKLKPNSISSLNPKSRKTTSKQDLSPTIRRSRFHPPPPGKESRAIRTKASRCTHILYDHVTSFSSNQEQLLGDVTLSPLTWKDSEPFDFTMDFDLDDKFLSDFLNNEIFETKTSYSSLNSDEDILFPSKTTQFLDSSLDWS